MAGSIAKTAVELLKSELKSWALAKLVAKASFFKLPIIGSFTSFIIGLVIDELWEEIALRGNFLWARIENSKELKAVIKSREQLQAVLAAGGNYEQAEDAFDKATDDLIRRRHDRLPS